MSKNKTPKAVESDLPAVDKADFSDADAAAHAAKDVPQIDDKFVSNLGSDSKQYGKVQSFQVIKYDRRDGKGEIMEGEKGVGTHLRIDH